MNTSSYECVCVCVCIILRHAATASSCASSCLEGEECIALNSSAKIPLCSYVQAPNKLEYILNHISDLRLSYQHNLFGPLVIHTSHYYTVTAPSIFTLLVWACSMQICMIYEAVFSSMWREWAGMSSIQKRKEQNHIQETVLSEQEWFKLQILRDGFFSRSPVFQILNIKDYKLQKCKQ